jgi:hypothetical protein
MSNFKGCTFFFFLLSIAIASSADLPEKGLETLKIDQKSYSEYLGNISYAKTLELESISNGTLQLETLIGKKVTVLGFVKPHQLNKNQFFSDGCLIMQRRLIPEHEFSETETGLRFKCQKQIQFKPFEIYQITGKLKQSDSSGEFYIDAQYAEPQAELSKIIYDPDIKAEVSGLEKYDWSSVEYLRDLLGHLVASSAINLQLPDSIAELADGPVLIEAWFTNISNQNFDHASGTMFISAHNLVGSTCVSCGNSDEYGYDNTALMKLVHPLSKDLRGGIFAGTMRINPVQKRDSHGFFTIENAVLVRPLSMPDRLK